MRLVAVPIALANSPHPGNPHQCHTMASTLPVAATTGAAREALVEVFADQVAIAPRGRESPLPLSLRIAT